MNQNPTGRSIFAPICQRNKCKARAEFGLALNVPAKGLPLDKHNPLRANIDLQLCSRCSKSARVGEFVAKGTKLRGLIVATMKRQGFAADFKRATVEPIPIASEEWQTFRELQGKKRNALNMFDIGQKIICVDASFPHAVLNYLRNLPDEGKVYTVRGIIPAQGWQPQPGQQGPETCAVLLVEIVNPPAPHRKEWGECGFNPNRFREVEPEREESHAEDAAPYRKAGLS